MTFFFVSESKLDQYDVISVDGFTFKHKPRQQKYIRRSGGVGIFVRNELDKFVQTIDSESEYAFWVKISKNFTKLDQDIVFGSVYIPPSQSRFLNEDEFDTFQRDVMSICSHFEYIYIAGDMNAQIAEMTDFTTDDEFFDRCFDLTRR